MRLANGLIKRHTERLGAVDMFDSREAWQRRDDPSFSQEEYEKHWLVQSETDSRLNDGKVVRWLAKGCDCDSPGKKEPP